MRPTFHAVGIVTVTLALTLVCARRAGAQTRPAGLGSYIIDFYPAHDGTMFVRTDSGIIASNGNLVDWHRYPQFGPAVLLQRIVGGSWDGILATTGGQVHPLQRFAPATQPTTILQDVGGGNGTSGQVEFWSPTLGCQLAGPALRLTHDGGKTWTPWQEPIQDPIYGTQLDRFVWMAENEIIVEKHDNSSLVDLPVGDKIGLPRWTHQLPAPGAVTPFGKDRLMVQVAQQLVLLSRDTGAELAVSEKIATQLTGPDKITWDIDLGRLSASDSTVYLPENLSTDDAVIGRIAMWSFDGKALKPEALLQTKIFAEYVAPTAGGPVVLLGNGSLFDLKDGQLVPHVITITDLPAWPPNLSVPEMPTKAEVNEALNLMMQLDPATEAKMIAQRQSMHDLSPRQGTIWMTNEAKRILTTRPSTQPAFPPQGVEVQEQSTPAEMSEMMSAMDHLDISAQRDLAAEGKTKTNLSPRDYNLWRRDEAKRMATTRPATPPAATP